MPWTPANPEHAIDRALIKFEFEPLPSKAHQRAIEIVRQSAEAAGLSDAVSIEAPQIQIVATPEGHPHLVQGQQATNAQAFRKLGPDHRVEYTAICANNSLSFDVRKYEGWDKIYPLMRACFEKAVRFVNDDVSVIQSVRFEYWDRFVRKEADGDNFLRSESKLVPALFSDMKGSWHSHVGFFKLAGGNRLLLNANIDIISSSDVRSGEAPHLIPEGVSSLCRIYTLCVISPDGETSFENAESCLAAPDLAHTELKAMLGNIINQQLTAQINLAAKDFSP